MRVCVSSLPVFTTGISYWYLLVERCSTSGGSKSRAGPVQPSTIHHPPQQRHLTTYPPTHSTHSPILPSARACTARNGIPGNRQVSRTIWYCCADDTGTCKHKTLLHDNSLSPSWELVPDLLYQPTYTHSTKTDRHTHRVHGSRCLVSVVREGRVTNNPQAKLQPTLEL